ncbi:hypothetical protein [Neobacillus sp. PS3-40]|uniref:hypothetical protein n=1 Tax=Neobacillus sp. PS3-40 TaxID=3070679 RepID=UPI0027E0EE85|nr:hypothetical protein [Neobacillus sp. PS3-40]WML44141.1 hypothetical protein RCG20_20570 [Neobacillus sp. PS3-40]
MKKKVVMLAAGLFLLLPSFGMANGATPDSKQEQKMNVPDDCRHGKHGDMMNKEEWQAKMKAREQQLLQWVDQYTPEKKAEWAKVTQEKNMLHEKWLSPEFAKQREQWKKEKMAEMQNLKKQYDEGKITKEELMKKAHGGKDMAHWKTFHDLKAAVESNNKQQVSQLLNQLLEQHKQHNQMVKEMLNRKTKQE